MGLKTDSISAPASSPYHGQNGNGKSVQKEFLEVEKKYTKIIGGIAGVSVIGILIGTLKSGLDFPVKAVRAIGDLFGTAATIAGPVVLGLNEYNNYNDLKEGNKKKRYFDSLREGFYRCCSLGFVPFIFEQFIDPKTWGKSIFHKVANIVNLPNLAFTGYTWGYGNFKAFVAWAFRTSEEVKQHKLEKEGANGSLESCKKRIERLDEIYKSCKRLAVIGSIANPTLQGLNQCADSLALLTGKISPGEFFANPAQGISNLVSLFVGIPESFAKGVDSLRRVTLTERKHLHHALPESWMGWITKVGDGLGKKLESDEDNILKSTKNLAEAIFHTLSPLSMFALFTPLLGRVHLNEEIQSEGGTGALLDKIIGRTGKSLTLLLTGIYVSFGRLPQSVFQLCYFGRKYVVSKFKGEDHETTQKELLKLKSNICNSSVVRGISKLAKDAIEKLVPDFYTNKEIEHGFQTFEFIQATYGFDQIKGEPEYQKLLEEGVKLDEVKIKEIVDRSLWFIEKNAKQSNHKLTNDERNQISKQIRKKIEYTTTRKEERVKKGLERKVKLAFPGADLLAKYVLRGFDLKSRLESVDWTGSHKDDYRNKETAYTIDELWNFDAELLPVLLKCADGARHTTNRATTFFNTLSGGLFNAVDSTLNTQDTDISMAA